MIVKQKKNGTFTLEAESGKENNAVCVLSEMVFMLAGHEKISAEIANAHGCVMYGKKARNLVTIPGMNFIDLRGAK